jgi:tRNA-specific 2-thiouridylase
VSGTVDAVELVTVGQRRGVGLPGGGPKRYVVDVDPDAGAWSWATTPSSTSPRCACATIVWPAGPVTGDVLVQCSAHGATRPGTASADGDDVVVRWHEPQRRVAPGQTVVFYDLTDTHVLGGGIAT